MDDLQTSAMQRFVRRLTSRSILTEDEVNALVRLTGEVKDIDARTDFVRLGEPVEHACLLVNGLVGRFGQNRNGARQITCLYIPGDMADLPSMVCPRSAWGLAALAHTTILRVPHADIRRVAVEYPGIAEALWRDTVADGSMFSEWVVNVGRRDARTRLAHVFCEMAIRYEQAGQGDRRSFPLPITQADLGDATGMTGVHVNRTLKELRDMSILAMSTGRVTIRDWNRLVKVGDFNPQFMLLEGLSPRICDAA